MRTRIMRTSLLTPILLALLFVCAGNALGDINPDFLYNITAKHSGKCLDVEGGGNGAQVIQRDCIATADSQKWKIIPVGDGYYKVIAQHSGKALDVNGGIFVFWNRAPVKQWDYWGGANQMWKFIPVGDDFYQIVAKHSGKSLDIDGGGIENDAPAKQYDYWGGDNQKWKLTALNSAPACAADQIASTLIGGSAELVAERVSRDPFVMPTNPSIDVTQCRGNLRITSLPPIITQEYPTPPGPNTTTVTLTGGGTGSVSPTREISMQVTLHFAHSLAMSPDLITAWLAGPSDLTLILRGPVSPDGAVMLTGSGLFTGGYLNGSRGTLKITGRLSPSP